MPAIRPIVLGVIRRGDALLVFEGRDDVKGETCYRPLGGGIEHGERSEDALRREFREELRARWRDRRGSFRDGTKILYPGGLIRLLSPEQ
ncbi:NUDIX domain-containing protein [Amycolatopsis australiensis]|nr:NUDIX domain-containing protein [Amycolatopsis australiensis]